MRQGSQRTPGHIRGVTLKDICIDKLPPQGNVISGYDNDGHKIEGLTIDGLYINGKRVRSIAKGHFGTCRNAEITFK